MQDSKKCKLVEQQCSACGQRFMLAYWEDGTYTYLDDSCSCQAEFFPLGPSLSEWIEQLKTEKDVNESKTFAYDEIRWSEQEIQQLRLEAKNFCDQNNGVMEHVSGIVSYYENGTPYYNDPSCWPKFIVYWKQYA